MAFFPYENWQQRQEVFPVGTLSIVRQISNRPKITSHVLRTVNAKLSWIAAITDSRYHG